MSLRASSEDGRLEVEAAGRAAIAGWHAAERRASRRRCACRSRRSRAPCRAAAAIASGPSSVSASSGSPIRIAPRALQHALDDLVVDRVLHEHARAGDAGLPGGGEDAGHDAHRRALRGRRPRRRAAATCRRARASRARAARRRARRSARRSRVEPVKAILATSGWSTSAAPASAPKPVTTLTTPGGKPACSTSGIISSSDAEVCSDGLDDDRVARRERRRELHRGQEQRRVPGRDRADDADRLAQRVVQDLAAAARG